MILTPRQKQVLQFIIDYVAVQGYAPSMRDIGSHFGIVINATSGHLEALERKGAIVRTPGIARSIRVVNKKPLNKSQSSKNGEAAVES